MQTIIDNIVRTYELKRRGNRWAGPCPKCGGSSRSDKFSIREDGGFKCYGCDFKGDIITWLREMDNLSCADAHEAAGLPCQSSFCTVRGTCRFGDGSSMTVRRHRASVVPITTQRTATRTATASTPADLWRAWAQSFVANCAVALVDHPAQLAWLHARGISWPAARRQHLGFNTESLNIDRASIGLPPERNGKTTLWVPPGLVIPTFDAHGQIYRLRIRRTDADRQRFTEQLKYVWVEGSGNAPLQIRAAHPRGAAVIVEAELDAIAIASAHADVDVIALGTVAMPVTTAQKALLDQTPVILVCLDADPDQNGKQGAGPKAVKQWLDDYRQARYWPVPHGKDPGDYVKDHHGNLHTWIEAALPAAVAAMETDRTKAGAQDIRLSESVEGGGEPVIAQGPVLPEHLLGKSAQGKPYVVANERAHVDLLRAHYGCAVFHHGEIKKLKGFNQEDAGRVLLVKNIFPGAEIVGVRVKA